MLVDALPIPTERATGSILKNVIVDWPTRFDSCEEATEIVEMPITIIAQRENNAFFMPDLCRLPDDNKLATAREAQITARVVPGLVDNIEIESSCDILV